MIVIKVLYPDITPYEAADIMFPITTTTWACRCRTMDCP